MRVLVPALLVVTACGGPAPPATLDRLRAYGFAGGAGESAAELEAHSRSSHLPAADEPPASLVEVDGLLRTLLPLVIDRLDDPRAATLAARLRALPPSHDWDQIRAAAATLGPALDVWEPDLPTGELARFSSDTNVARAAAPLSARTAVVVSIRSILSLVALFTGNATSAPTTPTGRESSLCPSEIADLAIDVGAPRDRVQSAVHDVVRAVRVADTAPPSTPSPPPCTPP